MTNQLKLQKTLCKELGIYEQYNDEIENRLNVINDIVPVIQNYVVKPMDDMMKISRKISDDCNSLEELKKAVCNFKELSICKTANKTVFADGNTSSKIMLIGEAPGANEDIEGIPFCGQSGKLMDKLLACVGLSRQENIYITNSVFWRPPGNRKPTNEECKTCLPFVEKHIALLNPDLIVLVGSTSAQAILEINIPISQMRNETYIYRNQYLQKDIPAVVVFHPSYLLRQPSQKKLFWQDLLKIKHKYL